MSELKQIRLCKECMECLVMIEGDAKVVTPEECQDLLKHKNLKRDYDVCSVCGMSDCNKMNDCEETKNDEVVKDGA